MSMTAAAQQPSFQELDHYIVSAMHDAEVPGLSIAVVKGDAVVFAKGYEVRKLGDNAPVNGHTIFHIASVTKGFTTASLAMLVDEGKLGVGRSRPEAPSNISALRFIRDPRIDSTRPTNPPYWLDG